MMPSVSRQAVLALLCAISAAAAPSRVLAQPEPDPGPVLDPSSPLEPMPEIGVDWPDMSIPDTAAPETAQPTSKTSVSTPVQATTDAGAEQRYHITIEGLEAIDATQLRSRFDALSTLEQGESKVANTAQVNRRAHEDEQSLRELLRAEGYYGASVSTRVEGSGARLLVTLMVDPGPLYHFAEVRIEGLAAAGKDAEAARKAFTIADGDAVKADPVLAATAALRKHLSDNGFPFAKVDEPKIVVDHATRSATLALAVDPGTFARFGAFSMRGKKLFSARHVERIARFHPGDVYKAADLDDLRRALISTGLISSVTLTPVRTVDPGVVDVAVTLERAPPRTIAGELGYGTGEGIRAEVSWTHRSFIKPEGAVTFRGVAGTREQYLGASIRRSNFKARDRVLTAQIAASHVNRDAYDARTFTIAAGMERQTNIIWQKKWTWSVGGELLASDERDTIVATGMRRRRTFYIAAVPGTLAYDGSDDLLDPKRGFRLAGRLSPEFSFHSGTLGYARAQIDATFYQPIGDRVVLAGRTRLGTIVGAQRDQIAPSRRYYSGGGGSVRGYGYQAIGPRDVDNNPIGGRSINEFAIEARIRFGDFGVVPFFDGGNLYTSPLPRFTGLRYGAGLGVRYYTSFGPIRVDVGTPLNRRPGDAKAAVYVSLGQAF